MSLDKREAAILEILKEKGALSKNVLVRIVVDERKLMAKGTAENALKRMEQSTLIEVYPVKNRKIYCLREEMDQSEGGNEVEEAFSSIEKEIGLLEKSYSSLPLDEKITRGKALARNCVAILDLMLLRSLNSKLGKRDRQIKKASEDRLRKLHDIIAFDKDGVIVLKTIWRAIFMSHLGVG